MKRRAISPESALRSIPMDPIQQSSTPLPPSVDGQESEKRKRSINSGQAGNSGTTRALRFDLPSSDTEEPEDPANSVSWLEKLSYVEENPPASTARFGAADNDDIEKLLQTGPRFSDLIRTTSVDATVAESLPHRLESVPAAEAEPRPMPMSPVTVGRNIGRFDEEEIRNRRRHHYRAHQPLKSLEPKVLRKVKDRIEWGRSQAMLAKTAGVQKAPEIVSVDDGQLTTAASPNNSVSKRPHASRRRRRRRRHRSKKAEPFQPTLGHVSEEHHSALELEDDDSLQKDDSGDDAEDDDLEEEDDLEEDELDEEAVEDEERQGVEEEEDDEATDAELMRIIADSDDGRTSEADGAVDETRLTVGRVSSADGRRPSFHLGGDSTRNSEVNLQSMGPTRSPIQVRQNSVDSCPDRETCCRRTASSDCLKAQCSVDGEKENEKQASGRRHHHHHHHREHFSKKDLQERCFSGAELRQITEAQRSNSQAPTEPEEAQCLKAKDLDDMNFHRLEKHQLKHHRHKPSSNARLPSSVVSVVEVDHVLDDSRGSPLLSKLPTSASTGAFRSVDHRPHDVFVELDELTLSDRNHRYQWNEKARWIRFEEDLVEGGERWGKPHVAPLSFHSLLQMRSLLESATFIKDLDATDLVQIADAVSNQLTRTHSASSEEAQFVRKMLLLKHSHVGGSHHHSAKRPPSMPMQERVPTSPAGLLPQTVVEEGHMPKTGNRISWRRRLPSFRRFHSASTERSEETQDDDSCQTDNQSSYRRRLPSFRRFHSASTERSEETQDDDSCQLLPIRTVPAQLGVPDEAVHSNSVRRRSSIGQRLTNLIRRGSTPAACLYKQHQWLESDDSSLADNVKITIEPDVDKAHGGSLNMKHKRSFLDILRHSGHGGVGELLTDDCEVVSSLVGSCPYISHTRTILIRLAHGLNLPKLSEVDRPIRFIFLFLVNNQPPVAHDYSPREIGRAFATLMADKDFHEIAYKAAGKEDMMVGLRDFLEKSIVLPPGDWDRQTLLPVVNYQRELMQEARRNQQLREAEVLGHSAASDTRSALTVPQFGMTDAASEELEPLMHMEGDRVSHVISEKDFSTPLPPSEDGRSMKTDDVKMKGRNLSCYPFLGLRNDLRRLARRYPGDWTDPVRDGALVDVIIASLFVFFVALAPAITFGALLETLVNERMSMDKSLVSAGIFLILMTLTGGQPQIVVGITGPVFIIETTIAMIASTMSVDYACLRFLVAIFASLLGIVFTAFNLASFLEIVPRSLEEIFNMFVAIFFIFKSCVTVIRPLTDSLYLPVIKNETAFRNDLNATLTLADAFQHFAASNSTALIAIGTYLLVQTLSNVKKGKMFTRRVRWFLGSFSVPMAILLMTGLGNLLFRFYPLKTLEISASASNPAIWVALPDFRLIPDLNVTHWLLALLIGACLHLLTFTETGICGLTLSKREQGTRKPTLFHLNVLVVNAVFPLVSGLCTWPFMTGAVVRSNAHTMALQVWEEKTLPGVRRRLVGVREQRLSGCLVGLLVFLCVFLGPPVLSYVPMGAMYGMFFYMGVSSFRGLQLVTRTKALLVRRRYWPEVAYLEAPLKTLWIFTLIEWTFVLLLFILNCLTEFAQMSYPSLFFPVILVLYGLLRLLVLTRWARLADKLPVIDKNHGIRVNEVQPTEKYEDMESEVKSRPLTPVRGISSEVYESSEDEDEDEEKDRSFYTNTDRQL